MQATAGVILLVALGFGVIEVFRTYLPGTRLGTVVIGRLQGSRANARLHRFGQARTIASATAAPVVPFRGRGDTVPAVARGDAGSAADQQEAPRTVSAEWIVEGFGSALSSPPMVRVETTNDLVEFARASRSGDLWLRVSDFDGWPDPRERRDALIGTIAAHPEWDDRAVYEAAIALSLWDDDGAFGVHRARNRKRVRRLRAAASRDLVYLDEVRASRRELAAPDGERSDHTAA